MSLYSISLFLVILKLYMICLSSSYICDWSLLLMWNSYWNLPMKNYMNETILIIVMNLSLTLEIIFFNTDILQN